MVLVDMPALLLRCLWQTRQVATIPALLEATIHVATHLHGGTDPRLAAGRDHKQRVDEVDCRARYDIGGFK
jgi:hypothetical protein